MPPLIVTLMCPREAGTPFPSKLFKRTAVRYPAKKLANELQSINQIGFPSWKEGRAVSLVMEVVGFQVHGTEFDVEKSTDIMLIMSIFYAGTFSYSYIAAEPRPLYLKRDKER